MNKTKPRKFTFKNKARATGLSSVGAGTPNINIRLAGVDVGYIDFNNRWNSKPDLRIQIHLMVPREPTPDWSAKWKWVTLKKQFDSGDEAKVFVNDNFAEISKMVFIEEER